MKKATATLIKRMTEDELFEVLDSVPLGREYVVDLDSICKIDGYCYIKKIPWNQREMIYVLEPPGWFPTELLDIKP